MHSPSRVLPETDTSPHHLQPPPHCAHSGLVFRAGAIECARPLVCAASVITQFGISESFLVNFSYFPLHVSHHLSR